MRKIELLAPAGNMESFEQALNGGADAVYLGLEDFNARGNIENFNRQNLRDTVRRAHLFGVKVYLTLNTLVQDNEVDNVQDLVRFCIDCKVDAYIVQDIGIAYLLLNKFEGIELHASTQMGINNLEGALELEKMGFKRVVLARETPLEEVRRIKENTNLEIEYFIQGALCVGFSGNCYLCSLLAGASGNRGKCKQFCRLLYNFNDKNEKYYLSARDICMLPCLKDLYEAGVTSFKIEGRARRPAYVGVAVRTYRKAIDNNFNFTNFDIKNLKKVFNRGDFISGYLKNEKIIYPQFQNHIGINIGKVIAVKKGKKFNQVTILSSHNLVKGDVIKILKNGKEEATISIFDVKNLKKDTFLITTTNFVPVSGEVRLIVDSSLEGEIVKRKIPCNAHLKACAGEKISLSLSCGEVSVLATGDVVEQSKTQEATKEECFSQISKCGNDFYIEDFNAELNKAFLPKSVLNALRRAAFEKLQENLIKNAEKSLKIKEKDFILTKTQGKETKRNIFICYDKERLFDDVGDNYLVYSPDTIKEDEIISLCQSLKNRTIYLDLPLKAIKQEIEIYKNLLKKCPNLGVYASNYYALSLCDKERVILSSEMNIANSYALACYQKRGYNKIVLSKEGFYQRNLKANCELFEEEIAPRYIYFSHCPIKEHIGGDCSDCKFKEGMTYTLGKKVFYLKRKKCIKCEFYLCGEISSPKNSFGKVYEI